MKEDDLRLPAQKREAGLRAQMGTISGTVTNSNLRSRLGGGQQGVDFTGAYGEARTLTGTRPKGFQVPFPKG
jgi:hypothetical protein